MMTPTSATKATLAGLAVALISSAANASDFNFGINNDTIELGLYAPMSTTSRLSAEYFYHDEDGKTLGLGYQVTNRTQMGDVAIGGKLVKLWSDKRDNGHAFAIGGDYKLPLDHKLWLGLSAYYAPSVLSSSGVDRYYHADIKVGYNLMPNADLFVGYRDIHFKFDNQPSLTLEQGAYLGAQLKF
ncbi:YfaZ family outer membrane protein [Motiliproteus sediminis]|uniref:YfaZ family outer membrane protein n=1 Tax=Motiliproteus sediminis TaxID=1468178 RepID=UPI001AEFC7EF|nr:YfaZ family outer membrane protein [Motiliproteus sediminis]